MGNDNKIIGLNNLLENKEYQASLAKKTQEIMGDAESLNTEEFLESEKFNSIFTVAEDVDINEIKASVKKIIGKDITKNEMNILLALMDANLEPHMNNNGLEQEKFVMDSQLEIGKKNGIFEATQQEIEKLQMRSFYFQDKGKPIAEKHGSDIIMKYEDGTVFMKLKWGILPTKFPTIKEFKNVFNNLNNVDD